MKIVALLAVALLFVSPVQASTCGTGEVVQSVLVSPGTGGTPEVSHVVHHPAVTHQVWVPVKITGTPPHIHVTPPHWETVVDTPAWDETVVDSPAVPGTDPVYEDQCVPDSNYVPPAEPVKASGGTLPFCSSPFAPGWRVDLPNGGCDTQNGIFGGVVKTFFHAGETVKGFTCPVWFFSGCVI